MLVVLLAEIEPFFLLICGPMAIRRISSTSPGSLPIPLPPPCYLPESNCSLLHCTNTPFKITHSSRLLVTTSASLPQI